MQEGSTIEPNSELGRQFSRFAETLTQKRALPEIDTKKRFIDFFSILPKHVPEAERRSA